MKSDFPSYFRPCIPVIHPWSVLIRQFRILLHVDVIFTKSHPDFLLDHVLELRYFSFFRSDLSSSLGSLNLEEVADAREFSWNIRLCTYEMDWTVLFLPGAWVVPCCKARVWREKFWNDLLCAVQLALLFVFPLNRLFQLTAMSFYHCHGSLLLSSLTPWIIGGNFGQN